MKNPERTIPSVSEGRIKWATASAKPRRSPDKRVSTVYMPVNRGGRLSRGEKRPDTGNHRSHNPKMSFRMRPKQKLGQLYGGEAKTRVPKSVGRSRRVPANVPKPIT